MKEYVEFYEQRAFGVMPCIALSIKLGISPFDILEQQGRNYATKHIKRKTINNQTATFRRKIYSNGRRTNRIACPQKRADNGVSGSFVQSIEHCEGCNGCAKIGEVGVWCIWQKGEENR